VRLAPRRFWENLNYGTRDKGSGGALATTRCSSAKKQ
jgi:hypothetical protein